MAIQSCDANLTAILSPNLYALSLRRDSMTDTSFPVKPINGYDHSRHQALFHAASHPQRYHSHAPPVNGDPGDDSISCICGFADDDGYTVQCDKCNRWQHQSCYYPEYDERQLPENLEHCCVDCVPKHLDDLAARQRQIVKRGPTEPHTNGGIKRAPSKSHKKKVKEPGPPYTNGWSADKLRHDRNSASPRDQQPPPAKRPKTSHRTSDSTTTTSMKGHSRKRNVSNVNQRRSLSRSPESPIERYSENFLRLYMDDHWTEAENNLHDSIAVTNHLSKWVKMVDDDFRGLHGLPPGEVLMRYDNSLDEIPGKATLSIVDRRDDGVQGEPAIWKAVIAEEPVPTGTYLGELKGRVCFKKDYQDDPANRWAELRHPEPFVFFHPKLPIALDARNEGTDLRFIRRSCNPNARLQILITDNKDYHFCFLATQDIEPGEEIAIGWETTEGMTHLINKSSLSQGELEQFQTWASTALANCGPCACGMPTEDLEQPGTCYFARFDRRLEPHDERPAKVVKGKKRKIGPNGQNISPLNTNTVNSRSGSEVRKNEPDDDNTDSQSASGSAGRGSASRDITPNTHYSTNGTGMPELSEREKKKLAKEEEMFRRQEEESTGKQAKKKRNSGGSSLNTPSATSSKQLGFPPNASSKYPDAAQARQPGQGSVKAMANRKPKTQKSITKPPGRIVQQPRPVYVDAVTQCDLDVEEALQRAPRPRKACRSLRQTLLSRCARNNQAILGSAPSSPASLHKSPTPGDAMDVDKPTLRKSPSMTLTERPRSSGSLTGSTNAQGDDTEMTDADHGISPRQESPADLQKTASSTSEEHGKNAGKSSPVQPASVPPLWSATSTVGSAASEQPSAKPGNMRLDMPPPGLNSIGSSSSVFSAGTPTIAQSPASLTPGSIFPPSVAAAVAPSPAKKKLSLSDYTRRKAKKEDSDVGHRESSPSSVASGPVVPPLQPSSSTEARAAEGNAIEEDVKMEEAENVPPTVTAA